MKAEAAQHTGRPEFCPADMLIGSQAARAAKAPLMLSCTQWLPTDFTRCQEPASTSAALGRRCRPQGTEGRLVFQPASATAA